MTETLAALFFAHVLADFAFQTNAMVANKRAPLTLLTHTAIVLATALAATGHYDAWEVYALAAAHLAIDLIKTFALPDRLWAFFADQTAHIATLITAALLAPDLFASGLWGGVSWLPALMLLVSGLLTATLAGAHAIRLLFSTWPTDDLPEGLQGGGRLIGIFERGIIVVLIFVGQPAGVGFLIAAKSVLRFESTSKNQKAGEYVIVGTLASFGWAMITAWVMMAGLQTLPPLGFPPALP